MNILEILGIPYFKNGSGIHIKEKNKGKFTQSAKQHGMGVQEFASYVLSNKDKYSSTLVKRANFAHNARAWKHKEGGVIKAQEDPVKTFDITNPSFFSQQWYTFVDQNSTPFPIVNKAPIDENELAKRQAWAESAGNDKARSPKGASGRYQIMPATLKEYQEKTKDIGDIYDPKYNRKVRDFEYNRYNHSDLVNRGNPSDSVRVGRKLAIYNYGFGNVRKALNKAESAGINTTTNFDWLQCLPKETQDYINFVLRGKNTGAHRNNEAYQNRNNK